MKKAWGRLGSKNLLIIIVLLQIIGDGINIFSQGSVVGKFCWLYLGMNDAVAYSLEKVAIVLVGLIAVFAAARTRRRWFFIVGLWFLGTSILTVYLGGKFASDYAIVARCVRFVVPFLLCLGPQAFSSFAFRALALSISLVFVTHGYEALIGHPRFIDYVIRIFENYMRITITESQTKAMLIIIGVQDVLLAVAVSIRAPRWALAYMTFWGALTATVRVLYSPIYGISGFLIRAANWGVPLFLLAKSRR